MTSEPEEALRIHRAALAEWRAKGPAEQQAWFAERLGPSPGTPSNRPIPASRGDRVRVGLCCPCIVQGGAEAWQLTLAKSVDASRIAWQGVVVIGDGRAIDPSMRAAFEPLMPIEVGRDAAKKLASECDVLVTWAIEDLPELVTGLAHPPKTVAVCHAPPESAWGQTVYARARPDKFVAVSELAREAIPEAERAGSVVIWNAVDEPRLDPSRGVAEMRASWGVPEGVKVAGLYQRLSDEKETWAAHRLAAMLPDDWRVVVIGQGWLRSELVRVKEEQGLDRLLFPGSDHAAGNVLRAFDCLIVPSDYESFCLSMAEALWIGTPVISTDVGLAKMWKRARNLELTRPIPFQVDGPTLAAAVLDDQADLEGTLARVQAAQSFARERLSLGRFGRSWTDLIVRLGESSRLSRVAACPDRGGVLPISMQDDCGCRGKEVSECRQWKGTVPGRVTLRDCLACQGMPR